jgi:hypothetical protein
MKFVVAALLFLPFFGEACSCYSPTDDEAYEESGSVILVIVKDTKLKTDEQWGTFVYANFDVVEKLKGTTTKLELLKASSSSTCAIPISAGYHYLIYSDGSKVQELSACTRSRRVHLNEDRALLNKYRLAK